MGHAIIAADPGLSGLVALRERLPRATKTIKGLRRSTGEKERGAGGMERADARRGSVDDDEGVTPRVVADSRRLRP